MGNLATPKSVQKLQMALHAKAKAEAGYRFYALYDKISRDDILAHAYAQCCSNKGAAGADGQDFVDIEAYGVEQWPPDERGGNRHAQPTATAPHPDSPQLSRSRRVSRTAGMGHEDQFPPPRLSARYRFSLETFARTPGNR